MQSFSSTRSSCPRRVQFEVQGRCIRAHYYVPPRAETARLAPLPAVVVSHGALGSKEQFDLLAGHLLWAGFVVLVPDMRGHGESEGERYHVMIADWVDDLVGAGEWLRLQPEVDSNRIGGFGFSSGGTAMLELAARGDCALGAVVTLAATVRSVLSPFETRFFNALGSLGRVKRRWLGSDLHLPLYPLVRLTPAACDPAVSAAVLDDPHIRAGYWRYPLPGALESLVVDTLSRVGNIRIPVCVLHGENDRVDKPASARALFQGLRGEKALHLIPRSGHMGHLDQSRERIFTLAGQWFQRWLD